MFPELSPLVSIHLFSIISTTLPLPFPLLSLLFICVSYQPPCHPAHQNADVYFTLAVFSCFFRITIGKDALSLSPKLYFSMTVALHWKYEKNKKAPDLVKMLKPHWLRVGNTWEHSSEGHIEECGNPLRNPLWKKPFQKVQGCVCVCVQE